jgi:hypothetical protein
MQQQLHPRNQQLVTYPFYPILLSHSTILLNTLSINLQDIKPDVGMPQRTMPADPSSMYASGMMHPKPALLATGW